MVDIYLDNNVFDFLYANSINIRDEFPISDFRIFISKHVKFETEPIKNTNKKEFIDSLLQKDIEIIPVFGFKNIQHPDDKQRCAGFASKFDPSRKGGTFSNKENGNFRTELNAKFLRLDKNEQHGLYVNETDIDLAVRSIQNVVLTFDEKRNKAKGPLNIAYEKGYKIVFLTDFDKSHDTLNSFVKLKLKERGFETW